jgi:hypothetical protein
MAATSASAGFFNFNTNNNVNGYQNDNGIFASNSYDFWDPRWYSTEFSNMVNEFDEPNRYAKGYQDDNGIFAYNGNDFWDPRWYAQEFTNMVNEIDDESTTSYGYKSQHDFPITVVK